MPGTQGKVGYCVYGDEVLMLSGRITRDLTFIWSAGLFESISHHRPLPPKSWPHQQYGHVVNRQARFNRRAAAHVSKRTPRQAVR
nr:hypothetical protein CFP56_33577 [Quercus suber]